MIKYGCPCLCCEGVLGMEAVHHIFLVLDGVSCQLHALGSFPFPSSGKCLHYPLIRSLGWPQSRSGHFGEEIVLFPLPGIEV